MTQSSLLNGMLLGAGLMYVLDPDRGRRRRALLRDQVTGSLHDLNDGLDTGVRDLRHRSYGALAEARYRISGQNADDSVVEARVRSELGRAVSHPGSIDVMVMDGRVTLSGPVLAREVDRLIAMVEAVPGVKGLENRLRVHQQAGNTPGLQGKGRRQGSQWDVMQENWAPATRLLASVAGGMLALYGLNTRGVVGSTLSTVGLGVLARGLTNLPTRKMIGADASRSVIDIHKSINVDAPVDRVFDFWSRFDNFPRFMTHLQEVRQHSEGLSHWVATGPAGVPVEWEARTTQLVPNEVISWKSVPGSPIANAGTVRFQPNERGGTRVDVRMTYNPPAGALGHAVASFFGVDPKSAMDEDLLRFKSLIEHGKTSAGGDEVTREEVGAAAPAAGRRF
ncbi:MAG: SRPBCC family protein [Gemmatimonadetes bacterium]|nr:SRPBCC family protein [Gemmatimonadota bacterium]